MIENPDGPIHCVTECLVVELVSIVLWSVFEKVTWNKKRHVPKMPVYQQQKLRRVLQDIQQYRRLSKSTEEPSKSHFQ